MYKKSITLPIKKLQRFIYFCDYQYYLLSYNITILHIL